MKERRLKLSKTVDAVKNDKDIIGSLADSIVIGAQQISMRWDWIDYLCIAITIVIVLLAAQLTYITVKIRTLSLLVAVMQQNMIQQVEGQSTVTSVEEDQSKLQLQYPVAGEGRGGSSNEPDKYDLLIQAINYHWFWLMVGTLIMGGILWLLYKKVA